MPQSGSYFIDRRAAEKAINLSLPMIHEAMKLKEVGESGFLYIVVMDPLLTPANSSFEEAILYEHAVGDRNKWDADYAAFAHAKARVAWCTGFDGHLVQELRPHLLTAGIPCCGAASSSTALSSASAAPIPGTTKHSLARWRCACVRWQKPALRKNAAAICSCHRNSMQKHLFASVGSQENVLLGLLCLPQHRIGQ